MKEKETTETNSRKLIIGVSILFCTVILIIGATTAFFIQSDTKETGNIVSVESVTLHYEDNDDYMLGDLIPINEDKIEYAYNREGNLKCKDDNGNNVCSIYQFTITNTGNVSQKLIIDLYPKVNGFTNLKFSLYDKTNNKPVITKRELTYLSEEPINLVKNLTLNTTNNNKSNTYEIVFYIKNDPYNDQSVLDSGKNFGANIKVNSVTTGKYILEGFGEECWTVDQNDLTKLIAFNGLNEDGSVKKECNGYMQQDDNGYYSVIIPSEYAGNDIKILGNKLFKGLERYEYNDSTWEETYEKNHYFNIKSINISEGIEIIEDGYDYYSDDDESNDYMGVYGTFYNIGLDYIESTSLFDLEVILPSTLKHIGNYAFGYSSIKNLIIPKSVSSIGDSAFYWNGFLTSLTFEGALDGTSMLETIGKDAFNGCDLNYETKSNPLIIPTNIKSIGDYAFNASLDNSMNRKLKYILYLGDNEKILNNNNASSGDGWYYSRYTTLLTTLEQATEE